MATWKGKANFPYRRFRAVGGILVFIGMVVAGLGVASVVYTEINYGFLQEGECNPPDLPFITDPCQYDSIIYSRVAAGIWCGFFILLAGAIGTCFSEDDLYIRTRRDALGVMTFLLVFPVCPAALAILIVQLIFMKDVFYYVEESSGDTIVIDMVMFILPLITAALIFVAWCAAIGILVMVCACADVIEEDDELIRKYSRPDRPAPVVVNRFRPQIVSYAAPYPEPVYDDSQCYSVTQPTMVYGQLPPAPVYAMAPPIYMPLPPPQPETRRFPYRWLTSRKYLRY